MRTTMYDDDNNKKKHEGIAYSFTSTNIAFLKFYPYYENIILSSSSMHYVQEVIYYTYSKQC